MSDTELILTGVPVDTNEFVAENAVFSGVAGLPALTDIGATDTATLKTALARSLVMTAEGVRYSALVYNELKSRGEDMSDMRSGLAPYLQLIAGGQLSAELVVRFAGQKTLLAALAKTPPSEQKRIADAGTVEVVRLSENGDREVESVSLHRLSASDIRYVFGENGVRSPDEQFLMVAKPPGRGSGTKAKRPRLSRRVAIDGNVLQIGNAFADVDRVLTALGEHYGVEIAELLKAKRG